MNSNFVACCTGESAGLAPLQDLVHVNSRDPIAVNGVRLVGHEPTGVYKFSFVLVRQRQPTL